jgi:HSP20 family protein
MLDHVRAIHRALTGADPEESPEGTRPPATPEQVARHFAELEFLARSLPAVAERLPPFSFVPPLDIIVTGREVLVDIGVPGVTREDVQVDVAGGVVTVSGSRTGELEADGRTYHHAELPRGPFSRVVRIPIATSGDPKIEVKDGVIRVRLTKTVKAAPATA